MKPHHLQSQRGLTMLIVILFRSVAGLYFTWVYHARGFGIAVGAHAGYDVLVGLLMRTG